jgi:hypothetical protein
LGLIKLKELSTALSESEYFQKLSRHHSGIKNPDSDIFSTQIILFAVNIDRGCRLLAALSLIKAHTGQPALADINKRANRFFMPDNANIRQFKPLMPSPIIHLSLSFLYQGGYPEVV